MEYRLTINGGERRVEADADTPMLWVLRDLLDLKGTKFGCGAALCGACTVLVDGAAMRSCQLPISAAAGTRIVTIEGVGETAEGARLQQAWIAHDVPQCGYCQAGQIMNAAGLLRSTPHPTDDQIVAAMDGNLCRCGTYARIHAAIKDAAFA